MKVLLFDLGGVVINWTGLQEMQKLIGDYVSLEDIRRRLVQNPIVKKHELGQCSAIEFADSFIQEFNLPYESSEFLPLYKSWAGLPYAGVVKRLEELRREYKLVCLSNTSAIHWDHLTNHVGVGEMFDHCFASHLLQSAKPDPKTFQAVLGEIGHTAAETCFFDDAPENVIAAEKLGMKACLVDPRAGVLPHLKEIDYFK